MIVLLTSYGWQLHIWNPLIGCCQKCVILMAESKCLPCGLADWSRLCFFPDVVEYDFLPSWFKEKSNRFIYIKFFWFDLSVFGTTVMPRPYCSELCLIKSRGTPGELFESLQTVSLRPLLDWVSCGFGQPSALADFLETCLKSSQDIWFQPVAPGRTPHSDGRVYLMHTFLH